MQNGCSGRCGRSASMQGFGWLFVLMGTISTGLWHCVNHFAMRRSSAALFSGGAGRRRRRGALGVLLLLATAALQPWRTYGASVASRRHEETISFGINSEEVTFQVRFDDPWELRGYPRHILDQVARSSYTEALKPTIALILTLAVEERLSALGLPLEQLDADFRAVDPPTELLQVHQRLVPGGPLLPPSHDPPPSHAAAGLLPEVIKGQARSWLDGLASLPGMGVLDGRWVEIGSCGGDEALLLSDGMLGGAGGRGAVEVATFEDGRRLSEAGWPVGDVIGDTVISVLHVRPDPSPTALGQALFAASPWLVPGSLVLAWVRDDEEQQALLSSSRLAPIPLPPSTPSCTAGSSGAVWHMGRRLAAYQVLPPPGPAMVQDEAAGRGGWQTRPHELQRRGRVVWVWTPRLLQGDRVSGGTQALYSLAAALGARGFNVRAFHERNVTVVMREAREGDVLVLSEAPVCDKVVHGVSHALGLRTVRWMLSVNARIDSPLPPSPAAGEGGDGGPQRWPWRCGGEVFPPSVGEDGSVALASSHYIQARLPFASRRTTVFSPLNPTHYSAAAEYFRVGATWRKKRLVVLDDDNEEGSGVSSEALRARLPLDVQVVDLNRTGLPSGQMPQLLRQASVLLDLHLPGAERAVYEAALCGALPLLSDRGNGADDVDFPLPGHLRVDATNLTAVATAVISALNHHHRLLPDLGPLVAHALDQPHAFLSAVDATFASFSLQLTISSCQHPAPPSSVLLPTLLTALYHFPLARLVVLVPHLPHFLRRHAALIAFLADNGLTSPTGGQPHHFLHFQPCPSNSTTLPHPPPGFPVSLVLRAGLVLRSAAFVDRAVHVAASAGVGSCCLTHRSASGGGAPVVVGRVVLEGGGEGCGVSMEVGEENVRMEEGRGGLEAWAEEVRWQQGGEGWEAVEVVLRELWPTALDDGDGAQQQPPPEPEVGRRVLDAAAASWSRVYSVV